MKVEIIVGSMLGATEYVADEVKQIMDDNGITSNIHLTPSLEQLDTDCHWIICTSTHGAGDLPDNIQAFAQQLATVKLPNVNFQIIALGDSNYDTFCQAGHTINQLMKHTSASSLGDLFTVDVDEHMEPELIVADWLSAKMPALLK